MSIESYEDACPQMLDHYNCGGFGCDVKLSYCLAPVSCNTNVYAGSEPGRILPPRNSTGCAAFNAYNRATIYCDGTQWTYRRDAVT